MYFFRKRSTFCCVKVFKEKCHLKIHNYKIDNWENFKYGYEIKSLNGNLTNYF